MICARYVRTFPESNTADKVVRFPRSHNDPGPVRVAGGVFC